MGADVPAGVGPLEAATMAELVTEIQRRSVATVVAIVLPDGTGKQPCKPPTTVYSFGKAPELAWLTLAVHETIADVTGARSPRERET